MKKKILVKGPALSASGYGEQTRFALRALKSQEELYDIYLVNIPWGKTGWVIEELPEKSWIDHLLHKTHQHIQSGGQFDISLQVTIPNEFEKIAPVNIGYTAGIETTKVAPQWIEKALLMNKIIVISNHSKDVFDSTEYMAQNQQTGQTFKFANTTPVEVVGFPVKNIEPKQIDLELSTDFNFLSVVQWSPRKNLEATVNAFFKEFKDDSNVGLVLKINMTKNSVFDRMLCEKRLNELKKEHANSKCKLYLLHGNMTEAEMFGLYTNPKIKAIVSTSHGEGFGLPLFEAVCNGLPVIAPKWSGHVDFLRAPFKEDGKVKMKNHFTTIDFDFAPVNKEAVWDGVIQADSQWCYTREYSVKNAMRDVKKNHSAAVSRAKKLQNYILEEFAEEKQKENMVFAITGEKPVKVDVNELPKISLITSVFNAKDYIEQLMENTTNQTIFKQKCEWILVDVNPPEQTFEENIIKEYCKKYPNIKYKRLDKDPGIYGTWNEALKMSTGEYITNINCDDRRKLNSLEKQAKTLFTNPDVSLVYNDSFIVHEPNVSWEKVPENCQKYNFEQFSLKAMLRGNLPHNNPMWRKELHNKFGYFDEKYRSAGDWEFWLRCSFGGAKYQKINEVLGVYYFNPTGISTNFENFSWKQQEEEEVYEKYSNIFENMK